MTLHIIDALTGEVTEREFNAKELKQQESDKIEADNLQSQIEAIAQIKSNAIAKLAALGLTEDEAKAIIG